MSYPFPVSIPGNGWPTINVNGVAYLTRNWFYSAATGNGCASFIDISGCAYLGAHEFFNDSSLSNFVGADAPKIGDFINTYDYTRTSGNISGRRCIEILDIVEELTYLTGVVTCPGTFAGDTAPYGNGNVNVYGYFWPGTIPCPCTVPAHVPQGVSVGSHWNSPFAAFVGSPIYAQAAPIPLSSRFTNCQTCIQQPLTQDCGCTDPLATNFVHQYGSHALQPCCTLCDGTDDNDCCTYTMMGCQDNNAWNFCHNCTMDCTGTTYPVAIPPWSSSNVDTTCCRYTCPPPPVIEATWDCCTYATCPETFQLHYGPNSDWGIANPGTPTPSVNPNSKFCQERSDGTGQYNSLLGKSGCNWNCKLKPPIIHHTVDAPKEIKYNVVNPVNQYVGLSQTVSSGLSFNPNMVVNCCDPTETYIINDTYYSYDPNNLLNLPPLWSNLVSPGGTFKLTSYTESFRVRFSLGLGGGDTGDKCWRLMSADPPYGPIVYSLSWNGMFGDKQVSCTAMQDRIDFINDNASPLVPIPPCCPPNTPMVGTPYRVVNCCDPTEEYQIGNDILQVLAGTGPQQQVQYINGVATGNLGITNYTEAFRANFTIPLTQPPWNSTIPNQEIPTNRKCWHLKESNSYAPYASEFTGAAYGLLTDKFPSCHHLNMWLFTRPIFTELNNSSFTIYGGPPYCGFNSSLFSLSAITSCEPCPPPDPNSPFNTNPGEFCHMCGPGQSYFGHIDCGCCPAQVGQYYCNRSPSQGNSCVQVTSGVGGGNGWIPGQPSSYAGNVGLTWGPFYNSLQDCEAHCGNHYPWNCWNYNNSNSSPNVSFPHLTTAEKNHFCDVCKNDVAGSLIKSHPYCWCLDNGTGWQPIANWEHHNKPPAGIWSLAPYVYVCPVITGPVPITWDIS